MIYLVHNDPNILSLFNNYKDDITFIDEGSLKGKKKAYKLKNSFSARLTPFAVVYKDDKVIKAFYSEAEDVINSLIKYLQYHEN